MNYRVASLPKNINGTNSEIFRVMRLQFTVSPTEDQNSGGARTPLLRTGLMRWSDRLTLSTGIDIKTISRI